jgi:opacity protein-like surface antigen
MRAVNVPLVCSLILGGLSASDALAGGIGVITTAGVHQERIYAYDEELTQYSISQARPNLGAGVQGLLGDRDDRILGYVKMYYQIDSPQVDNDISGQVKAQNEGVEGQLEYAVRTEARDVGVATVGVQWGILPNADALQIIAISGIGAGALTIDSSEFILVELGAGAQYALTDQLYLHGELAYQGRYRKALSQGAGVNVGVRFMFD